MSPMEAGLPRRRSLRLKDYDYLEHALLGYAASTVTL